MNKDKIVIIGSCNIDMVVTSEQLPKPGETVLGDSFQMHSGGKGANQAVAAVRMGGDVSFIAKVGDDFLGKQVIENYKKESMDVSHILIDSNLPTGVALINVDKDGENSIAVAPGANAALDVTNIEKNRNLITEAGILLMQLEIPMKTVEYAAKIASENKTKIVLNPAPAAMLSESLLKMLYAIIPNKSEAEIISGIEITSWDSAKEAANIISSKGVEVVVITLGEKGALIKEGFNYYNIPGNKVDVCDTTAAGDTFCGTFCVAISEDIPIKDAVILANKAASIAVSRQGAQSSIPCRNEVFLQERKQNIIKS